VTLATLQDATAAPDHAVSFRFRQPRKVQGGVPSPTRSTVRHLPDGSPVGVDALMPLAPTVDASFGGSNRSP